MLIDEILAMLIEIINIIFSILIDTINCRFSFAEELRREVLAVMGWWWFGGCARVVGVLRSGG